MMNPNFELRSPVIQSPDESWIRISVPLPTDILRRSFIEVTPEQIAGTILDFGLRNSPGVVRIIPGFEFYYADYIFKFLRYNPNSNSSCSDVRKLLERRGVPEADIESCFTTTAEDNWFYIPQESNLIYEIESGRAVIDHFQRAVNKIIVSGNLLLGARDSKNNNQLRRAETRYQQAITQYFSTVKKALCYKGGYLDSKISSVMPYSGRAVIIADPLLDLTAVGVPKFILHKWFTDSKFREVYDLQGLSFEEACRKLTGTRILFGRQPSHDCSNFFSIRMKPTEGPAISVHPMIVNLFDGDFDGDTCHLYALTTREGRESLLQMGIESLLPECKPKREFSHIRFPRNPDLANQIARKEFLRFMEGDKLGLSIDLYDILNMKGGTGYFNDKKVHREDLRRTALGFSRDEAFKESIEAMLDYRQIKQGVAQAGGISNCFMQLGIVETCRNPEKKHILRDIQRIKHILCQGMLNRKHGNRQESGNKSVLEMLTMMFYRFQDCPLNTREEYLNYMIHEAELPEEPSRVIIDLFFKFGGSPPRGIYQILEEINPLYVMTRNPANMTTLKNIMEQDPQGSLHDIFLRARIEDPG